MHISLLLMNQIIQLFIMILMGFIIVKANPVKAKILLKSQPVLSLPAIQCLSECLLSSCSKVKSAKIKSKLF